MMMRVSMTAALGLTVGDALPPPSFDWAPPFDADEIVGPVINAAAQHCTTAAAIISSVQAAWNIATEQSIELSVEQLLDCGACGGSEQVAWAKIGQMSLCTAESYRGGDCNNPSCDVGVPKGALRSPEFVGNRDINGFKEALEKHPILVDVDASSQEVMGYDGGVLSVGCSSNLNQKMLLVGYGEDDGKSYWKLKNTWGAQWGENGYIRLERMPGCESGSVGIRSRGISAVVDACTGSDSPEVSGQERCYTGVNNNYNPHPSEVVVKLLDFDSNNNGHMSVEVGGDEECKHGFTKEDQDQVIRLDSVDDCVPEPVTVNEVRYCSFGDMIEVKLNDERSGGPGDVTVLLARSQCESTLLV